MKGFSIRNILLAIVFLALAVALPELLMNWLPTLAAVLYVAHIPIYLCGFICGGPLGFAMGMVAPVLRSVIFGAPDLYPEGVAMMFEYAFFGLLAGVFFDTFRRSMGNHRVASSYLALVVAMVGGRAAWGLAMLLMALFSPTVSFSWDVFINGAFRTEFTAMVLQIIIVPGLVAQMRPSRK